ncbi:MAG: hypothetical protein ACFFEF_15220, partial [Candidatus Thorarchaeota archaeon]
KSASASLNVSSAVSQKAQLSPTYIATHPLRPHGVTPSGNSEHDVSILTVISIKEHGMRIQYNSQ